MAEIADSEKIKALKPALEADETAAKVALEAALRKIGNLVHESVPVSKDEVRPTSDFLYLTIIEFRSFHEIHFSVGGYDDHKNTCLTANYRMLSITLHHSQNLIYH